MCLLHAPFYYAARRVLLKHEKRSFKQWKHKLWMLNVIWRIWYESNQDLLQEMLKERESVQLLIVKLSNSLQITNNREQNFFFYVQTRHKRRVEWNEGLMFG